MNLETFMEGFVRVLKNKFKKIVKLNAEEDEEDYEDYEILEDRSFEEFSRKMSNKEELKVKDLKY